MKVKVILSALMVACLALFGLSAAAKEETKKVDVLFFHDTHSHLNEFSTVEEGRSSMMGGFAKIRTLINEKKAENPDTLILDGGDFSMGTLVQTVYETDAAELRMLGALGVDVSTLGNHEYDYRAKGLANMLKSAVESGDVLPQLVLSNVDWEAMEEAGLTDDQKLLREAFESFGIKDYVVVEKGEVKIAVFGIFGIDSESCVVDCPLVFKDRIEAAKETVAKIGEKEDVDLIACVSHSGTVDNEKKSEDELIAKAVPEIDLIISGHTHTRLDVPIQHGDTYIVSAGEYGKYLGSLSMTQKENGRWELTDYEVKMVDDTVLPDAMMQEKIDEMMALVDTGYLSQFGYTKDQILCTNEIEFASQDDTALKHTENNLGSIIADAYTYAAEQVLGKDTVAVSVAPSGTIRDSYTKGNITTEQVFNSFSLGIGKDQIPGYPLIGVYLTGKELKTVSEIDASISDIMTTARLYTDGLYWKFNPNRMILNKVTDAFLVNNQEERIELEDDSLYLVVTDYYTSQMLGGVTELSKGLLSLVPKFADGTPIENYEDAILTKDGKEVKAWVAIADYMSSFEDTDGDGYGNVPEKYGTLEGRKVVEDSKNPVELLKHPNRFFFMITGAVLLLLAIVAGIITLLVKLFRKIRCKRTDINVSGRH